MRLAEVTASRENNFDVLRLAAASAVLFVHCFPLTGNGTPALAGLTDAVLAQGVPVFFAISGFLIARSWCANPQLISFAGKRGLRLLPALVVAVAITAFAVGPLFTTLPLSTYLTDPTPYLYVLRCAVLITFGGVLPGVFEDNPYPDAVNGSLWTLPIEATAYAIVATLGVLGLLLRSWGLIGAFLAAWAMASPFVRLDGVLPTTGAATGAADGALIFNLFAIFLSASVLYVHRARIVLNWTVGAAAFLIWFIAAQTEAAPLVGPLVLPYLALLLAYRTPPWLRRLARPGDVSYGVYIYAFPIQQMIAATWATGPLGMLLLALPAAYLAGLASWKLIERRALAAKRHLPAVSGRGAAAEA